MISSERSPTSSTSPFPGRVIVHVILVGELILHFVIGWHKGLSYQSYRCLVECDWPGLSESLSWTQTSLSTHTQNGLTLTNLATIQPPFALIMPFILGSSSCVREGRSLETNRFTFGLMKFSPRVSANFHISHIDL